MDMEILTQLTTELFLNLILVLSNIFLDCQVVVNYCQRQSFYS